MWSNKKLQKILVKVIIMLTGIGFGFSCVKENYYAMIAWVVALFMSLIVHSMILMIEDMDEDAKFWKRNFLNTQERYSRSMSSSSSSNAEQKEKKDSDDNVD